MQPKNISPYKIAFTYIGTIIGAGFATGQEILQFFSVFGLNGVKGILLAMLLYTLLGYIIMELGFKLNCTSHKEILSFVGGKYFGGLIDFIITFFLLGTISTMIAGSGALIEQQFHISPIWGSLAMILVTSTTILLGINGLIGAMGILVPLLLVSILGITITSIVTTSLPFPYMHTYMQPAPLINHWLLAAVLYVSYNTIISIGVLGPLGVKVKEPKIILKGVALGSLALGLCSLFITLALWGAMIEVGTVEIPMLTIAQHLSPIIQWLYSIMLFIAIYTTAVGSTFAFISRMIPTQEKKSTFLLLIIMIFALILGNLGFSNLVKYLYPIEGYVGIILLVSLLWGKIKLSFKNKNTPL